MRKEKLAVFSTMAALILVPALVVWYQFGLPSCAISKGSQGD